jgi:CheY-like chemotaxis protein
MLGLLKRKPRLLVLDDDVSMQRLVSTILRRAGYRIDVVSAGSQAIEMIARERYDGLLLDLMSPTEGGLTVIRHLRQSDPKLLRRVVLVTASPDSVIKNVEKEVFAIVRKPFEPKELIDTIARVVGP